MWGAPLKRDTELRGSRTGSKIVLAIDRSLLHNRPRSVKRKRAMLESNPPGIADRKLIETMSRERRHSPPLPHSFTFIGSKDFPMPKKTHALVTIKIDSDRACSSSNSTGDRYPSDECSRLRL